MNEICTKTGQQNTVQDSRADLHIERLYCITLNVKSFKPQGALNCASVQNRDWPPTLF